MNGSTRRGSHRSTASRLEALARAAETGWSAEADIDWSADVVRPAWLTRKSYAALVSQLYHGERATGRACRRLMAEVPDRRLQRCLDLQALDERRHARVFERYLARIGDLAPPDEAFEAAVEQALAWTGSHHGLMVAVHVVLEGEALRALQELAGRLPCLLFRRINRLVAGDEARHVALGRIGLDGVLSELPQEERFDIYRRVRALWQTGMRDVMRGFPILDFGSRRFRRTFAETGWRPPTR